MLSCAGHFKLLAGLFAALPGGCSPPRELLPAWHAASKSKQMSVFEANNCQFIVVSLCFSDSLELDQIGGVNGNQRNASGDDDEFAGGHKTLGAQRAANLC